MVSTKKGFTLIELLVVIAIIALLLAIVLPSLKRAKEISKRLVCMSNQRQLSLAWTLYAEANDEKFCSPAPGLEAESWVAWKGSGWPNSWDSDEWEESITEGALFPYTENQDVYRCPAGEKNEQITYTSFPSIGWRSRNSYSGAQYGEVVYKMSELKQTAQRGVYIDEGRLTPDFYMVHYQAEQWIDQPSVRHNEGVTISFADAHAEHWKWQDARTKEMSRMEWSRFQSAWQGKDCPDNDDLYKVRRAAWGSLGP